MSEEIPLSAARALYEVLADLDASSAQSPFHAWKEISGVSPDDPLFARHHVALLTLLDRVSRDISALPSPSRDRYTPYFASWWAALVRPRADWATALPVIERANLDMLAALADLVETRDTLVSGGLVDGALEQLRALAEQVRAEAADIPDADLSASVRDQIVADMEHVLWLIDHSDTYGAVPAVQAMEMATGRIAAATTTNSSPRLRKWAAGAAIVLSGVTSVGVNVTTMAVGVPEIYDRVAHVSEEEIQEIRKMVEGCQPRKQIEAKPHDNGGLDRDGAAGTPD